MGEDELDAVVRRRFVDVSQVTQRYPDDYAGKIISVRPDGHRWTQKDVADPGRAVADLDLTTAETRALRDRESKLDASLRIVTVTFDDEYGATAAALRAQFNVERELTDVEQRLFDEEATRLRRLLPKTVVHSGQGVYEVGPTKTYSTIQSALDQLWTDQGSAAFTANQYIRIFADTYVEYIQPNLSLNPDENSCGTLIIEGDPADDRDNVILQGDGSAYILRNRQDHVEVRHLKFNCTNYITSAVVLDTGVGMPCQIHDCTFTNTALNKYIVHLGTSHAADVWDCDFDCPGVTSLYVFFNTSATSLRVRSSKFKIGTGRIFRGATLSNTYDFEGCSFRATGASTRLCSPLVGTHVRFVNCTFYGGQRAIDLETWSLGQALTIINCIFQGQTHYVFDFGEMPEEVAGHVGPRLYLRNNYYYDYGGSGAFAYTGANKTYAEFMAGSLVNEANQVNGTDPKMTDPDNDDFSLQSGSPCINAGHGSGVITGYNGVAFDPNQPDVGAWSSGTVSPDGPPTWTDNTSNIVATDAVSDGDVNVSWDAATASGGKDVGYIVQVQIAGGGYSESFRTTATSGLASGLTNDTEHEFRVDAYSRIENEPTTVPVDTATATPTAAAVPGQITISAADQEDGDSIVVTVTGAAEIDARVYYRLRGYATWLGSSERTGNGTITFTGLDSGTEYAFGGVGVNGDLVGIPSDPAFAWCTSGSNIRAEIRQALAQRLYTDATLSNLVSGHVHYVRPPKKVERPCVTYHVAEDVPQMGADEYGPVDFTIQVDVWAQGDAKMNTLDKIVDAVDSLLTDWRVDTTNWKGLRLRRTSGSLRVEAEGEQQRVLMWALTAVRKGL